MCIVHSTLRDATIPYTKRCASLGNQTHTRTFGFCRHESQRRKNQKSCFLPTLERIKMNDEKIFCKLLLHQS
jgi:hypothetical protein